MNNPPHSKSEAHEVNEIIWDGSANTANQFFGDRYTVDWEYESQSSQKLVKPVLANKGDLIERHESGFRKACQCCFIPDQLDPYASRCPNRATHQIWYSGQEPDNYTESCVDHVGQLLTDEFEHSVFKIEPGSPRGQKVKRAVCQ